MADVSAEVLADLITALEAGKTFRDFIQENNLQGTTTAPQIRQQFIQTFGQEYLQNIMRNSMSVRMQNRWSTMASRMQNVTQIDSMINTMTNAITNFEERKVELLSQSSSTSS